MLNLIDMNFLHPVTASGYEREEKTPETKKAHPEKGQALT